ncbi:hypothetical protein [Nonomuraea salmonea]|uniref:hypothetical protein n=1 Tax=Nonomuraea salmonea TaxID=46181 RepID=UPI0031EB44D6
MTATTVGRVTAAAPSGAFKGTRAMLRLALRRDRVKLPTWTLGIALFLPYFASVANATNPTAETLRASAKMMDVPMLRLFSGPMFGMENPTVLKYLVNAYFPEFLLGAALMSMLLIARHTRAEEQSGRAELVRAAVVGRQAALTAALLLSVLTNVLLALLLTAAGGGRRDDARRRATVRRGHGRDGACLRRSHLGERAAHRALQSRGRNRRRRAGRRVAASCRRRRPRHSGRLADVALPHGVGAAHPSGG